MPETMYDSAKNFTSSITAQKLSRQELLEVSQNISLYFAPRIPNDFSKLVLLTIDPQYLHAYWNVAVNPKDTFSKTNSDRVLRVYAQEIRGDVVKSKPIVDYKIKQSQTKQLIKLPITNRRETYFAKIGELNSEEFIPSISSNNTADDLSQKKLIALGEYQYVPTFKANIKLKSTEKPKLKKTHHHCTNYSGIGQHY